MQKRFDKCVKTKIKYYNGKCRINVHFKGVPLKCACLSIKLIEFVFRIDENYYPQVFLEEYKCAAELLKIY